MGYIVLLAYMLVTSPMLMVLSGFIMIGAAGLGGRTARSASINLALGYAGFVAIRAFALWGIWAILAKWMTSAGEGVRTVDLLLPAVAAPYSLYFALTGIEALVRMFGAARAAATVGNS
jgi:hypothetical protein